MDPYHTTSFGHSLTNPVYQPAPAGHPSTAPFKAVSTGQHVVVCGTPYVYPYPVEFSLKERVGRRRFIATDANGAVHYREDEAVFSLRSRRTILDAGFHPVVSVSTTPLSPKWFLWRGAAINNPNHLVATVKRQRFAMRPEFQVTLAGSSSRSSPDFLVKGDFLSYNYQVLQQLPGGQQRVVASVYTVSPLASGKAFLNQAFLGTSTYKVRVEPGVDAAFMLSLIMLAEENMGERHDINLF